MFKKNTPIINNPYDIHYKEIVENLGSIHISLRKITTNIIIKNGTFNIYPECAAKENIKKEIEEEQYKLICCIGNYDNTLNEMKQYWAKHHEQLDHCATWAPNRYCSARRIIENTYERFYTNN